MNQRIMVFSIMALVAAPLCAFGGDESKNLIEKYEKCGELSSYPRIEGCFFQVHGESDRILNKEYNELIAYLSDLEDKKHKQNLINSQRAWIKFRDLDCNFYSDGQPVRLNKCLSERTIKRLKELEYFNTPYAMGCNGCPW
jgi:uncharacterized protein YecT (DUF1311 family)